MGADLLGTADNCTPIPRDKFSSEDSINFFCLNDEIPYIYLKSKVFEYIFTDQSLIKVERDNAAGVKQQISRWDWQSHNLSNILFDTPGAGMTDYSCSIKFYLGNQSFEIDIIKAEMATARVYYHVLNKLSREMRQMKLKLARAESIATSNMISDKNIGQIAIDASNQIHDAFNLVSYKHVFESSLQN